MTSSREAAGRRVIILASVGRDGPLARAVLEQAGILSVVVGDAAAFCQELSACAGVAVVAEEAFTQEQMHTVLDLLTNQSRWSDLPFVVLTSGGHTTESRRRRARYLQQLGHITLLERPVRAGTLVTAVQAGWRSRQRQYELRDYLAERERTEEALIHQANQLVRANADLQQFAYVTSHDLQEPLRTIASFAQLLELRYRDQLDAEAREFIGYVTSGVHRMQSVIDDLLAYSRLVHRPMASFESISLTQAVDWACENLRRSIEESEARICYDGLPTVAGDRVELVALFQNLLSNAIKCRRPDAPLIVYVRAERNPDEWRVAIQDNGVGFEAQYAERIFGLFQRLHGKDVPGTGLGLTICRKVVERHGGRIWAEGQPGVGATFSFTLPVR